MDFRELVRRKYLKKPNRILEFGPLLQSTAVKVIQPGIPFADISSTKYIEKQYSINKYLEATGLSFKKNSIVEIDFVINNSNTVTF